MLTNDDVKIIRNIVKEEITDAITSAVAPLVTKEEAKNFATKSDVAKLDSKLTKFEVNMTRQFTDLKNKTTKDAKRLERCLKTERKLRNEDFGHLEKEDRKISIRVDKIERHLNFVSG